LAIVINAVDAVLGDLDVDVSIIVDVGVVHILLDVEDGFDNDIVIVSDIIHILLHAEAVVVVEDVDVAPFINYPRCCWIYLALISRSSGYLSMMLMRTLSM